MRLYRPTGLQELALVFRAQMKAWPPRLDDQPIFYPVMNVAYAREIAKGWNTKFDSCVGYVTQFEVDETYISQFSVEIVGDKTNAELWIPAEELSTFNDHMIGDIEVVEAHFGRGFLEHSRYDGYAQEGQTIADDLLQWYQLIQASDYDGILELITHHQEKVFLHYPYWLCADSSELPIDASQRREVLELMDRIWGQHMPYKLCRAAYQVEVP